MENKFPWLPPHAADPGGPGDTLCLKHQRRSSHGRPKAPNLHFMFLSGAAYVRGATLFKYTGCGACKGGHYRNLSPVFFDHFGTILGVFSVIFGLGGAPATSGGTPWPPEGSQGHFGRSFCHSIASFWGLLATPRTTFSPFFRGCFPARAFWVPGATF